uniref:Uncharacterized protein n=1 Tax=Panagrellus redivivus TaxID=6233 RepID=A0A7E4VTB6_PANRE
MLDVIQQTFVIVCARRVTPTKSVGISASSQVSLPHYDVLNVSIDSPETLFPLTTASRKDGFRQRLRVGKRLFRAEAACASRTDDPCLPSVASGRRPIVCRGKVRGTALARANVPSIAVVVIGSAVVPSLQTS